MNPLRKIPAWLIRDFPWQGNEAVDRYVIIDKGEYRIARYYPQEDHYELDFIREIGGHLPL